MDRPPADPAKLLSAWTEGETGETTPGRTMSNLKTAGLRDVLEHLAADVDTETPGGADATKLLAAWMEWETGDTVPATVTADLRAAGMSELLAALAAAAAAVLAAEAQGTGDGLA